jgi:hypothetical protein
VQPTLVHYIPVVTTILAIPNYRLQVTDKTVFQYWEVPAGQPRALRAWFYPGDNFGQEFAYPKQKSKRSFKETQEVINAATVQAVSAIT